MASQSKGTQRNRSTYSCLCKRRATKGIINLVRPRTLNARENVLLWDIADFELTIVFWVVFHNHALNFILGLSEPAFFQILEDAL